MVVCKCRKATRLYCFVHKVPVCGECICYPEHQICVVRKYSDWVVDGEYDWPTTCSLCNVTFEDGNNGQTTRLGCLHLMHTECLVSHIRSFLPQTAPAGYMCPSCSSPIWPPKSIKDTGSQLHSKLKEAIILSGLEKYVFGNHVVSLPSADPNPIPPAFASDPLVNLSEVDEKYSTKINLSPAGKASSSLPEREIVEIDDPSIMKSTSPVGPSATTRKGAFHVDRQNSEVSYYADDEDGSHKKYIRRGPFRHKLLRMLLPFWSNALPTLPVTAPTRKDGSTKADGVEGRPRHQKLSRMNPRKALLIMAIIACMTTMGILYFRLAQGILSESHQEEELQ
ncbi:putative transcription factor C2H2 family [Dioscorea sansibarensis]